MANIGEKVEEDVVVGEAKNELNQVINSAINPNGGNPNGGSSGSRRDKVTGKCPNVALPKNKVTFKPCCPLCPSSMYDRHDVESYDDAISFLELQMKQKRDVLIKHKLHRSVMDEAMDSPLSFIEIMMQMKENKANPAPSPISRKCGCSLCPHNIFSDGATPFGEPDTFEDRESKSFDPHALKGVRNKQNKRKYVHD